MASLAGQAIKDYELLERAGAGSCGVVFRAYQSTLGREVAVKVILPGYANKPDFIRRFEVEAQLVARLEHLHIVPLYDYWRDPEGAYLVMRWMRGGSLGQALAEGPFDLKPAALLLEQVAAGLAAAHSQSVIHCDLKASNILLDDEGNAYVSDFGIARILGRINGSPRPEGDGAGLDGGQSPEQARGEPPTVQTDVYGLGLLLYETLTGAAPFAGLPAVQRLYKHLNDPLPRVENLSSAVAEEVNAVLQKATAKDPRQRFQDALEMAAAFRLAANLNGDLALSAELLTAREEDVLERIVAGMTNREIAEDLFIEVSTVKWYITQLYRKLGVRSRKQAIARAREVTLLAADEADEAAPASVDVTLPEPVNPYKGLRAFDVADARDFFGREEIVQQLVDRLARATHAAEPLPGKRAPGAGRFLALVGPSGSGKSSLLQAGLIPALRRGAVPGADQWFTVQLTPGRRPLDQLEIALTRIAAEQAPNLRRHLERDASGLARVAALILPQNESELLVVVDQFEELFTLVEDEATRAHFLALLATAASETHSRVRVLLALRADYYDRPLHYPQFGQLLRQQMETILPLSAAELKRAIERPAAQVGVAFEPGLVETMIDDIQYQPGALPLLQYALTELFAARQERLLTHDAYESIGGAAGALVRRAEEPYQEQDEAGRQAIRQLFLRLVALDEGGASTSVTRQKVGRTALVALLPDGELGEEMIDTFAAYRLLTLDHDPQSRRPTVEIAHDALLHEWGRLRDWVEESRDDLRQRRQLARAAEEWRKAEEDPSFLLRGTRLQQFQAWSAGTELALAQDERAFLQASAVARDARAAAEAARQAREVGLARRARRVLQALLVVLLVAAVVSGWFALDANRQREEAERNAARAERSAALSESQRLAAEASSVLQRGGSAELAALLALRALDVSYTPQADLALQRASAAHIDSTAIEAPDNCVGIRGGNGTITTCGVFAPLVSPDDRYLRFRRHDANGFQNQMFELRDMQTGKLLWQARDVPLLGDTWTVRDFTADYTAVILSIRSADGIELAMLDVTSGETVRTFGDSGIAPISYQLSADGTIVAAGTQNGAVYVWDTATGEEIRRFSVGEGNYSRYPGHELFVAISPDSRLVAAKASGQTHVWDIASDRELYRFENGEDDLTPPQFADGDHLLLTSVPPALRLWDLSTGQEIGNHTSPNLLTWQNVVMSPRGREGILSPDGRLWAQGLVGLKGKDIVLWEVTTGKILNRLTGHTDGAVPAAFTSDGRRLVTRGIDGTARVWDTTTGQELITLAGHSDYVLGATLSADNRYLVTAGDDGTVRIWDLEAPLRRADNQVEGLRNALYPSPGGQIALSTTPNRGTAVLVDANSLAILHRLDFALDAASPAFSSDGRMVVGVSDLGKVQVYNVRSGELVAEYANPDGEYRYAAFVPGSHTIFAGGERGAYLLDAETGAQLHMFSTPDAGLYGANGAFVTVSPDGHYGALHAWTADSLNVVYLWNLETGDLIFRSTPQADAVVEAFAFSADSRLFAWGGSDSTVHLLDVRSAEEVTTLAHLSPVLGIAFSSDGRLLLTSALDDSVNVWDLETGEVVRRFYAGAGPAGFVAFAEDDTTVLYATAADGVIHRQSLTIDGLIATMCSRLQDDLDTVERQRYGLDERPTCPRFAGL